MRALSKNLSLIAILFSAITSLSAQAEKLVTVTAELYPTESYGLGMNVDSNNQIQSIYFQDDYSDDSSKRMNVFSLDMMRKGDQVLMQTKEGRKVVTMTVSVTSPTAANVTLNYLSNGLWKSWGHIQFKLYQDANGRYVVVDQRKKAMINSAMVQTNYWGSKAVGIAEIETSLR